MSVAVFPQVQVFEDFTRVPNAVATQRHAHISGPQAFLRRYAIEEERVDVSLGYYDWLTPTSYLWPERPAGAIVDTSYVKLWIRDALLPYYQHQIGQGTPIYKTANYNNRVHSATQWATNGVYARDSALLSRDVAPGDTVKVRGLDSGGNPLLLWTYVQSLAGDPVPTVVAPASTDVNNIANQTLSVAVAQVGGALNCVTPTADASTYDGLAAGNVIETYDLLITGGSVNGDYTTATVRVISGSGNDDVTSAPVSARGTPTAIGTRGLKVTFATTSSAACSASAADDMVTPDDLIVGQRWHVTVHQAFTKPVPTSGGVYTGVSDTVYIVKVALGGKYTAAVKPQIKVTTTNGVDLSGPTPVPAAGTAVAVGSLGVTISFSGTALRGGDLYYIDCTGAAIGPMSTIVLGHNLDTTIAPGSEVDLTLYIRNPLLQVTQDRIGFAPQTNWETSETEITVADGIMAYDASWTNNGIPAPLPVISEPTQKYGELFVEYRAWLSELTVSVGEIDDIGLINSAIPGALDPDNPLKWGVFKALENSNGVSVLYSAVANPDDPASWAAVLEKLLGRDDVYGLVPLTYNGTVLNLYAAHVSDQSGPDQGQWRVLWVNQPGLPEVPVVSAGSTITGYLEPTTTDGKVCLAVAEDDPNTSGSQFTIVRCTSGNGAFLTNGVRPNDIVRMLWTGDGFGNVSYSEFIVDLVHSEDEIRLLAGPAAPISVGAKIEIWRNLTGDEEAAAIAANSGAWGSRRVMSTWPDLVEQAGTIMPGYFLNCSLAGLASGILPWQGMTHLQIVGYSDMARTDKKFNRPQLDVMMTGGTWIVTQDRASGNIYTRKAVTTGSYLDINSSEEMVTRNVDSVAYQHRDLYAPFIGVVNVTPSLAGKLSMMEEALIRQMKTVNSTADLGAQLIDATVVQPFTVDPVFRDRLTLVVDLVVPYALNVIQIHLVI